MGSVSRRGRRDNSPPPDAFRAANAIDREAFIEAFKELRDKHPVDPLGWELTPDAVGINVADMFRRWLDE